MLFGFFICLTIFDWVLDIVSFILLDVGFCSDIKNIFGLCCGMHLNHSGAILPC